MTLRLFLLEPEVVFQAQVNMASITYPIDEVAFDNVTTGAFGDIVPGMTVLFGDTAGGDNLGRQRVRKAATSNTLYIGRSSRGNRDGEVNLADGRHISILNDYRVWAKVPFIADDGTVSKDADVPFQDELPPVSNVGAGMAGTIDSGTSKLQVTLPHEANTSFATHDGASISTFAWDLPSGVTLDSGTINDSQITVNCDPGFYWIACTVTDSNGNAHGAHVPVLAIDPTDDPTVAFQVESHVRTPARQELSVRILEDIPESTYPDGTLVMIWDGEPSSATDRSHMEFVGWHQTDDENTTAERTGTLQDTVLNCLDAAGKLATLPGFPQTVAANDSPENWLQMADPNMDKHVHYLLYWHSTALELADFSWSGTGSTFEFVVLSSDGESLWDQVNRRAQAMTPDYLLTCNRLGQLAVTVDPMVQDAADRSATVQKTLTEATWRDVRHSGQRPPRIHWHRRGAIVASNTEISAVFCVAPGESPGQGLDANEQDEKLTPDQATLNAVEGHRYARMNAPQGYFNVTLVGSDDYDIEPADLTWVQLDIPATFAARRNLNFTNERGLVRQMDITYEHGSTGLVKTIELLWERETSGTPAVTYTIPEDEVIDYPEDPPDPGTDPFPDPVGIGTLLALVDDAIDRTADASVTSPTYTGGDIGPAGTVNYDLKLDPWDPTTAYVATDDGLYKTSDWTVASPSWSQVLSPAEILSETGLAYQGVGSVVGSIHQEDYVGMFYGAGGSRVYFSFSEDGGSTWTTGLVSSNFNSVTHIAGAVADRQGGFLNIVYAAHNTNGGRKLFRSVDKGATWAVAGTMAGATNSTSVCVHVPYNDNTDGDIVYIGLNSGAWRTTNGGSSFTALPDGTNVKGGIGAYTGNRQRVWHWRTDNTFWISTDAGDNWTQKNATGISGTVRAAGGFPNDQDRFYALTTGGIFISSDGGATFNDKTGDWAHGFTIDQHKGGTIVPLWTE